jgi:rhodanese-related sulfurtransferase
MKEHFQNFGIEINGLLHLTGKQALACIQKGALLVDVREDFEIAIKDFGIAGKTGSPLSDIEHLINTLARENSIIIADCVGLRSKEAALQLLARGFTRVANLVGGISQWERDGLPMKKDVLIMSGQCPCAMRTRKN